MQPVLEEVTDNNLLQVVVDLRMKLRELEGKKFALVEEKKVYQPKTLVHVFSNSHSEHNDDNDNSGTRWYHIVTPLTKGCCCMYKFHIDGYSYGSAKALDVVYVGYPYSDGRNHNQSCFDRNNIGLTVSQYFCEDKLVLKFGPIGSYCTSFGVYFTGHYNNSRIGLGDYKVHVYSHENDIQHL